MTGLPKTRPNPSYPLSRSPVLTVHLPLDASTRLLLDAERIGRMREGAFLIKAASGGIVDEGAVKAALKSGRLAGAAFDVFATEPPTNAELFCLDSFIVTPHIGGSAVEAVLAMGRAAIRTSTRPARRTPPTSPEGPMATVLYIIGCNRSGSTLLNRILGSHPEMAAFGELCGPRGVAWSLRKNAACATGWPNHVPSWKSSAYWSVHNLGAELAVRGVAPDRIHRVRYEDLVREPARVVAEIGDFVGVNTLELGQQLAAGADVPWHHMLSGNRLRKEHVRVQVREDTAWQGGMGAAEARAIRLFLLPQMARYGYRA